MATKFNPRGMQQAFGGGFSGPPAQQGLIVGGRGINIYETDDSLVAEMAFPGIPEEKINVSVEDGVVRATGSLGKRREEMEKRQYLVLSLSSSFGYSFRLPQGVIGEKSKYKIANGVLTLTFPKEKPSARIEIKVSNESE